MNPAVIRRAGSCVHETMRAPLRRVLGRAGAMAVVLGFTLLAPASVAAHPLGNFTINHYAGIRIEPDRVVVDVVIDEAEIPAFQERQRIDTDGDGVVTREETEAERLRACPVLGGSLQLSVAGRAVPLEAVAAGLSFPAGAGGLPTMRLVCTFVAAQAAPMSAATPVAFADTSHPERIGWREITVQASGASLAAGAPPSDSVSKRLTVYPTGMLAQPLDVRSASFAVSPGGPVLAPFSVPDATPLPGAAGLYPASDPGGTALAPAGTAASVPGGVGGDIAGLLETRDLSPLVLLTSILVAVALGAGHALTPGHGKTLMGAYLVGTRGRPIHAITLGLSVTVAHTLGIVALAGIVIAFRATLPPEAFNRIAPVASGLIVLAIGGWLVMGQLRLRRTHAHDHDHSHRHGHGEHDGHNHDDGHDHDHGNDHGHDHGHEHGEGPRLTWRSLFVLGLAGGIIPSTNALLILLATIATGRAAYGLVLVVAFGLGMALVLSGVGLALVYARARIERLPGRSAIGRLSPFAPAVASVIVLVLGVVLTTQALASPPTL
jgi:ABC-type nickel/cobalt efflux system permease component RcnA